MIAVIDIGNTNIVFGCMQEARVLLTARFNSDSAKTDDEYAVLIYDALTLKGIDARSIEGAIISSVVPQLRATLAAAFYKLTGKKALAVGAGVKTGLNILADNPAQVGSDLIVGAVAAIERYPIPSIVFDLGTATTLVAIDKSGSFAGYMIMPGLRSSVEGLARGTSQLPAISLDPPSFLLGKNTVDAMRAGAIYSNAAMLDGLIDRVEEQFFKEKSTVIATGGLARAVTRHCRREITCDDDLLLYGLYSLYLKNQKNK